MSNQQANGQEAGCGVSQTEVKAYATIRQPEVCCQENTVVSGQLQGTGPTKVWTCGAIHLLIYKGGNALLTAQSFYIQTE